MGWVARGRAPPCCVERVPHFLPNVATPRSRYSPDLAPKMSAGRRLLQPFPQAVCCSNRADRKDDQVGTDPGVLAAIIALASTVH